MMCNIEELITEISSRVLKKYGLDKEISVSIYTGTHCESPCFHGTENTIEIETTFFYRLYSSTIFYTGLCKCSNDAVEIFKYATTSIILHEVGHIKNNYKSGSARIQEDLANEFEFSKVNKIGTKNALLGSLIAMFSELEIDVLLGRNPCKEYGNHPSTLAKIDKFLSDCPRNQIEEKFESMIRLAIKIRPILQDLIVRHKLKNIMSYLPSNPKLEHVAPELGQLDDE